MIKHNYFVKGKFKISVVCLTSTVDGLTKSGAYGRCTIWRGTNKDLDWLFRPVYYRGKALLKLEGKSQSDHDNSLIQFEKEGEVVTSS